MEVVAAYFLELDAAVVEARRCSMGFQCFTISRGAAGQRALNAIERGALISWS